jgi:hypothetical protein
MSAMSVMRFALLGAVGFGVGGATSSFIVFYLPGQVALPLALLIVGAVGGASLGLALKDFRRVVILAGLGALSLFIGLFAGLILGSFFNFSEVLIAAMVGAVVGASLGLALGDWRTIVALAVAGAVGFGIGSLPADALRFSIPLLRQLGEGGSIAIIGTIGGASLGAALGYLENRKLAERQSPRVR